MIGKYYNLGNDCCYLARLVEIGSSSKVGLYVSISGNWISIYKEDSIRWFMVEMFSMDGMLLKMFQKIFKKHSGRSLMIRSLR